MKTVGDSVMAAFADEKDGLMAAVEIQRRIGEIREWVDHPVEIKVGLHSGPVLAVNANDLLDYFGRTVNLAFPHRAAKQRQ